MKTIICDIDGTLLFHKGSQRKQILEEPILLDGVSDKIHEWDKSGYTIVLITGRRESTRSVTEKQLEKCGIIYDKLIMGVGRGERVLINDRKVDSDKDTALCFNLERNAGIKNLKV